MTVLSAIAASRPAVFLVDDDPAVAHAVQFSFDLEGLDVRNFRDAETRRVFRSSKSRCSRTRS